MLAHVELRMILLVPVLSSVAFFCHVIANTGAMLVVGQERSKEDTTLTVEPGCSGDSRVPPSTRATELSHVTLWLA